jgi:hypothetical protein
VSSNAGALLGTGLGMPERAAKVGSACGSFVGSPGEGGNTHTQRQAVGLVPGKATWEAGGEGL